MTSTTGEILERHQLYRMLFHNVVGTTSTAGREPLFKLGKIVKIGIHLCPWSATDSSVVLVRADGEGPVIFQLSYAVQCGLKKHIQRKTSRSTYGWNSCVFMFDLDIKTRTVAYTGYTLTHPYVDRNFGQVFCEIYKSLDNSNPYLLDIINPLSTHKRIQRAH